MTIRTKVSTAKAFEKQLRTVPEFIRGKVMFWIFLVESNGLAEAMRSPGFHDEPLKGVRSGQRSVRMNRARVHIELLEINKHDY